MKGRYKEFAYPWQSFVCDKQTVSLVNSVYTIAAIIFSAFICKKLPASLNILIVLSILIPLFSGNPQSMTRFVSVIFPLFLITGNIVTRFRLTTFVFVLLLIMQLITFYPWLIGHKLGF